MAQRGFRALQVLFFVEYLGRHQLGLGASLLMPIDGGGFRSHFYLCNNILILMVGG